MTKHTLKIEQLECDRCGRITDDQQSDLKGAQLNAQMIKTAGMVMNAYQTDLCGNCLDSFIDWWNTEGECQRHARIERIGQRKKEFLRG